MRYKYIFNTVFITALLVLVLNDHFLKGIYGNWFTGKLSDFAGLLMLPLFLKCLLPVSNRNALLSTVVFFVFWKSPLMQPLIDGFNAFSSFHIARVVDYSDFLGFLVLPLASVVLEHPERFTLKMNRFQPVYQNLVLGLTIVAFVATSPEDDFPPEVSDDPTIASCCQTQVIETSVGNGNIFIPTIFTPDGNGINDFFQVVADTNILRLDTFLIYDLVEFDTVFYAVNVTDITPVNGFDGVVGDTILAATYNYILFVTAKNGTNQVFSGSVCSVPCAQPLGVPVPLNVSTCAFATQHSFPTGYDPNVDSGELLDCFD